MNALLMRIDILLLLLPIHGRVSVQSRICISIQFTGVMAMHNNFPQCQQCSGSGVGECIAEILSAIDNPNILVSQKSELNAVVKFHQDRP